MKLCESKNRVVRLGPLWALHWFINVIKEPCLALFLMQCVCTEFWWIWGPRCIIRSAKYFVVTSHCSYRKVRMQVS